MNKTTSNIITAAIVVGTLLSGGAQAAQSLECPKAQDIQTYISNNYTSCSKLEDKDIGGVVGYHCHSVPEGKFKGWDLTNGGLAMQNIDNTKSFPYLAKGKLTVGPSGEYDHDKKAKWCSYPGSVYTGNDGTVIAQNVAITTNF